MKKQEIYFGDLNRWLFGQAPPEFMIEVLIRTVLIFLFLLLIVRLMGSRMSGQITLTEFAVMITLGAIVSPAMQLPDRGLLFGVVGLICALAFQRGINLIAFRKENVEKLTQGVMSLLIRDGKLDLQELKKTTITKQQLYSMLREKKIYNLGKVERAYLEACGVLSVYVAKESKPGLATLPKDDPAVLDLQQQVDSGMMACANCGQVQKADNTADLCKECKSKDWTEAYILN